MSKEKHHIIPDYICKVLWPDIFNGLVPGYKIDGKEFYFKENVVWVERLDHARIHWGYFCDDLEPLFEYITPAQWIIDLIPRGDNRDMWAAQVNAMGEIDGIDMSGENNPMHGRGAERTRENNPYWKGGISLDLKAYQQRPEYKSYQVEYYANNKEEICKQSIAWRLKNKDEVNRKQRERRARKKAERQDWVRGPYKKKSE